MTISRVHFIAEGRVQGVYYRAFTQNQALRLGLNGWVRNLSDGRVEAVFEGSRDLIEEAITACRRGPSGASVLKMSIDWEAPEAEQGFEIRYQAGD